MEDHEAARAVSRAKAEQNRTLFRAAHLRDMRSWALEREDEEFLTRITTRKISGRALLSNEYVQRVAQDALIDATVDAGRRKPDRQWLWITITSDHGITFEREPVIDYVSLRGTMDRHLRRSGLHGFGVIEVDTWKNLTGENGRRMVAHAHFLGYRADGKRVGVKAFQDELCKRRALANSLGAPGVVVKNVKPSVGDFARIGRYMFKLPAFAKMYRPERDGNRAGLKSVGHARGSAARLVEIFSQLEVGDVMFSIGGGRPIADKVREAIVHETRVRRGATEAPSRNDVMRYWRRIRLTNGSQLFREPTIITRKEHRVRELDRPR